MGRKLKGKITKKLSEKEKTKKEETLKKMDEIREEDNTNLRDVIKQKLSWAINEKQKGISQVEKIKAQVNRLEGIILFCKDILNPQEEDV